MHALDGWICLVYRHRELLHGCKVYASVTLTNLATLGNFLALVASNILLNQEFRRSFPNLESFGIFFKYFPVKIPPSIGLQIVVPIRYGSSNMGKYSDSMRPCCVGVIEGLIETKKGASQRETKRRAREPKKVKVESRGKKLRWKALGEKDGGRANYYLE